MRRTTCSLLTANNTGLLLLCCVVVGAACYVELSRKARGGDASCSYGRTPYAITYRKAHSYCRDSPLSQRPWRAGCERRPEVRLLVACATTAPSSRRETCRYEDRVLVQPIYCSRVETRTHCAVLQSHPSRALRYNSL